MKAAITNIKDYNLAVENDGKLSISTGNSRFETHWKNKKMLWSALLARLEKSQTTGETHAEYMKMSKEQQNRIKDIGGFVGGHLKDGRRKTGYVAMRQIVTLDLDFAPADFWNQLMDNLTINGAMAVYSTHKHSPKTPRFRLIIPLDRDVTPDEYEAIARKLAEKVGMDWFDPTTFQPTRLMYWPSNSADVEPFFKYYDAPFTVANEILQEYPDWTDVSYWPMCKGEIEKRRLGSKQQDPLSKKGIVGLFCRTYSVTQAIEKFLPDVYEQTLGKEDRYTYKAGSTSGGVVIYDNDTFSYSNHSTDPASNQACNAFDLVRIHLFGDLDDGHEDKSGKDAPSYKAMADVARDDEDCKRTAASEQAANARQEFAQLEEAPEDWVLLLERNAKMEICPTLVNAVLIVQHDEGLQNIAYNDLKQAIEKTGPLPWRNDGGTWRDADDAQLLAYMNRVYQSRFTNSAVVTALTKVADDRHFNPLREYIQALPEWDGVSRVDTLLIDYLGAEDSTYTRAVTRKTLVGAVQRVLQPGCKFDTMLVLDGPPGIGKSTLLRKLGGEWFDDSLSLADTRDKTAAEKLQGKWIMEIGEMQGTRKADIDIVKGFLSRQDDAYRAAYGRVVQSHPRTCIICGTTNSTDGFLRDTTGNRRFWPVPVKKGRLSVWEMTEETRAQIWAEAMISVAEGETTYLDYELEREAARMQLNALEFDEREGEVAEYLDTLLPADWYSWDLDKRVDYFQQRDVLSPTIEGTMQRTRVSTKEIYCECLGLPWARFTRQDGDRIKTMLLRIGGWKSGSKLEKVPGYGPQRCYHRCTGND